jgi:hypothetical protein
MFRVVMRSDFPSPSLFLILTPMKQDLIVKYIRSAAQKRTPDLSETASIVFLRYALTQEPIKMETKLDENTSFRTLADQGSLLFEVDSKSLTRVRLPVVLMENLAMCESTFYQLCRFPWVCGLPFEDMVFALILARMKFTLTPSSHVCDVFPGLKPFIQFSSVQKTAKNELLRTQLQNLELSTEGSQNVLFQRLQDFFQEENSKAEKKALQCLSCQVGGINPNLKEGCMKKTDFSLIEEGVVYKEKGGTKGIDGFLLLSNLLILLQLKSSGSSSSASKTGQNEFSTALQEFARTKILFSGRKKTLLFLISQQAVPASLLKHKDFSDGIYTITNESMKDFALPGLLHRFQLPH